MIERAGETEAKLWPWLEAYAADESTFDECLRADGSLREAFAIFGRSIPGLDGTDLKRRADAARRIIQEQGITYTVYGDPRGTERPWQLDPLPFPISAAEWHDIETGLIQRAILINRILVDCYGTQELIHSGRLPPALVFGQPDFLRPCHGIHPPDDIFLHLYAADLARSPDGQWWVISDRTQIPTGAGYALANRLITSRILHDAFRDCHVQRLAGFYRDLQTTLSRLGSRWTNNPRVVVLTPGPFNETYFEQAWLARYLGYTLVEGHDLAVRDDRVFLKTLSGLERVDVILRRVDDDWCDPLELRNDSMLGVPGLIGALRAGHVAMANALGSGLLQSPAFKAFLPGLCQHFFSEDLLLPSVATWWCGQEEARAYVLEHLSELAVKPAFRSHVIDAPSPEPSAILSEKGANAALETLRSRILFKPELYVGQERIELSTAPAWDGKAVVPRPVLVRCFLVATEAGYRVMPGGLTRAGAEPEGRLVSMQLGGISKDTWVLAQSPVEEVTLLGPAQQVVELRRVGNNLPSRLADNYFWMGRYAERSDATARILRSLLLRFSPESGQISMPLVAPLLGTLAAQGQLGLQEFGPESFETLEAELLRAIFDPERRGSLHGMASELQRLAMLVRDRTSHDLWRVLTQLDVLLTLPEGNPDPLLGDFGGVLNQTLLHLAALHGIARENMTRAQGWRFLDIGLRIERAVYLCAFLDASLHSPEADNPSMLETVLEVCDSTLTYRSRYNLLPHIVPVYDMVLLDDTNPRSLLFQFNQLVKHFERLPRERESALPSPGQRVLLESLTRLRLVDPFSLNRAQGAWHTSDVGAVIGQTLAALPKLSDAIAVSYFAHSSISRMGKP